MQDIIFVHGMFQTAKSWDRWINLFNAKGYNCVAPAWPLHEGEPGQLRASPPEGLGQLRLDQVIDKIRNAVVQCQNPIVVGHSVGGLIAQILLSRGEIPAAVAISPVAPNRMLDFDWGFFKNSASITNPFKGDEPVLMTPQMFHDAFANTLDPAAANAAYEESATHDSRNVLRDCMGPSGKIDMDKSHGPLLLIAGEQDQIVPSHLVEKNAKAYTDKYSVTLWRPFPNRSHYICAEPGWEEVAEFALGWISQQVENGVTTAPGQKVSRIA